MALQEQEDEKLGHRSEGVERDRIQPSSMFESSTERDFRFIPFARFRWAKQGPDNSRSMPRFPYFALVTLLFLSPTKYFRRRVERLLRRGGHSVTHGGKRRVTTR